MLHGRGLLLYNALDINWSKCIQIRKKNNNLYKIKSILQIHQKQKKKQIDLTEIEMHSIIKFIFLFQCVSACLQPEVLLGSFTYKTHDGQSYIVTQVVVPKLVDTCTEDLFVYFHLPESQEQHIGYLKRIPDEPTVMIVEQSIQLDCQLGIRIVFETETMIAQTVSNVILLERKYPTSTPQATTFSTSSTTTSSSTVKTSTMNSRVTTMTTRGGTYSAHKTSQSQPFDFEFSFYKFINDVNDIILIFSHSLHVCTFF